MFDATATVTYKASDSNGNKTTSTECPDHLHVFDSCLCIVHSSEALRDAEFSTEREIHQQCTLLPLPLLKWDIDVAAAGSGTVIFHASPDAGDAPTITTDDGERLSERHRQVLRQMKRSYLMTCDMDELRIQRLDNVYVPLQSLQREELQKLRDLDGESVAEDAMFVWDFRGHLLFDTKNGGTKLDVVGFGPGSPFAKANRESSTLHRRARSARSPPPPSAKAPVKWDTVKAHLMTAPASALRVELVDGKLAELRDYQFQELEQFRKNYKNLEAVGEGSKPLMFQIDEDMEALLYTTSDYKQLRIVARPDIDLSGSESAAMTQLYSASAAEDKTSKDASYTGEDASSSEGDHGQVSEASAKTLSTGMSLTPIGAEPQSIAITMSQEQINVLVINLNRRRVPPSSVGAFFSTRRESADSTGHSPRKTNTIGQTESDFLLTRRGMPFITLSDCLTKSRPTVEDVSLLWMCAAQRRHYNRPKRLSFFSKIMLIFKAQLFGDSTEAAQHLFWMQDLYSRHETFDQLASTTMVMLPHAQGCTKEQAAQVLQHLLFRVPVYSTSSEPFDKTALQKYLGWQPRDGMQGGDGVSYVLAGRVGINPKQIQHWGLRKANLQNICVAHAWGCDFSQHDTQDYRSIHLPTIDSDEEFARLYRAKTIVVLRMCCESALRLGCTTVRIPPISCAAHLAALPPEREAAVMTTLFPECVDQVRAMFPSLEVSSRNRADRVDKPDNTDSVGKSENLFDFFELESNTMMVNSWDSKSFIGNGGVHGDDSINTKMIQHFAANSCFLQNPCFVPRILDPRNWTYLSRKAARVIELGFLNQSLEDCFGRAAKNTNITVAEALKSQFGRDMTRQRRQPLRVNGQEWNTADIERPENQDKRDRIINELGLVFALWCTQAPLGRICKQLLQTFEQLNQTVVSMVGTPAKIEITGDVLVRKDMYNVLDQQFCLPPIGRQTRVVGSLELKNIITVGRDATSGEQILAKGESLVTVNPSPDLWSPEGVETVASIGDPGPSL